MRSGYEPPSRETLTWVAQRVHPRATVSAVSAVVPLTGGITAHMDRITVGSSTGCADVVLRRWPNGPETDGLVSREVAALETIEGHAVPAPHLLAADEQGTDAGVRCTLTTALVGTPDLAPTDLRSWLEQLATAQAAVHAVPPGPMAAWEARAGGGAAPPPDRYGIHHRPLDWLTDPGLRAAAREAADGSLGGERAFVHGDYQHFNVLWSSGRLTGVVDWPSAGTGSRGTDVGHCRLNLAVLFDASAATDYLAAYERAAGERVDRRADLRALLCFDLEWQRFIPHQVDGRAPLDVGGMPDRVAAAVRAALDDLG